MTVTVDSRSNRTALWGLAALVALAAVVLIWVLRPVPLDIRCFREPSGDPTDLQVVVMTGHGMFGERVSALRQNSSEIMVAASGWQAPGAFTAEAFPKAVNVTLSAPLGNRPVRWTTTQGNVVDLPRCPG